MWRSLINNFSILFYFILFYFILFYFILFYCIVFFTLQILFPPHGPPLDCYTSHTSSPPPVATRMSSPPTLLPHMTSKGASSLLKIRCIIPDWTQTHQSSAVYLLGTLNHLAYSDCLEIQCLRDRGSRFVESSRLPIGLPFSTFSSLSIIQSHMTQTSLGLSISICFCLSQGLVGPLSKQQC